MNRILSVSAATFVLGSALTVQAAGFQLSEYSTTNLGRSFAGAGMVGDDFSAIGYNPAGIVFNEKSGIQLGASTVGIRSHAKGSVKYGSGQTFSGKTDPYIVRVLPQAFGQYKINDRVTAGIGVYVPFGLVTDYDNDWFGRSHAGRSSVQALNVSPALAVKATNYLSLGASLNIQHISANLTGAVETDKLTGTSTYFGGKTDLEGDDLLVGYTVGFALEPVNGTRVGVSYRSHVEHKLTGTNTVSGIAAPYGSYLNGKYDINAKITTPEMVIFSANQKINDRWNVSATARWTRWTRFKNLTIYRDQADASGNYLVSDTKENWSNTWFYALGTDYKYNNDLTLRLGGAYDDPAVESPLNRTARIPDGRRWWASFGFSYEKNNWQLDGGYAHLFVKSVRAKHGSEGSSELCAKYSSNANIFSLAAQYKF